VNTLLAYIFAAIGIALADVYQYDTGFYLAATKQYFFAFGYWFCVLCNFLDVKYECRRAEK